MEGKEIFTRHQIKQRKPTTASHWRTQNHIGGEKNWTGYGEQEENEKEKNFQMLCKLGWLSFSTKEQIGKND
jgi:hypothetical protein